MVRESDVRIRVLPACGVSDARRAVVLRFFASASRGLQREAEGSDPPVHRTRVMTRGVYTGVRTHWMPCRSRGVA